MITIGLPYMLCLKCGCLFRSGMYVCPVCDSTNVEKISDEDGNLLLDEKELEELLEKIEAKERIFEVFEVR